ncbi:MAG: hypothetical protein ACI94Y_000414 [Maribacter sp.]|jgi:uncharacterized protein YbjT (DUF2867 family)
MSKTAVIIGATGLVGSQITHLLIEDERYEKIVVFVRRTMNISSEKLEEHIVDYDKIEDWKHLIQGDELYSALGTTLKKAGSKERQYTIDFQYQYNAAKAASENGVKKYLLVSSAGANHKSPSFYTKMKGELDEAVKKLDFSNTFIFRPSLLAGERDENRLGEKIGYAILQPLSRLPFIKKYRPIFGYEVALAMINTANRNEDEFGVFELDEIFDLLK